MGVCGVALWNVVNNSGVISGRLRGDRISGGMDCFGAGARIWRENDIVQGVVCMDTVVKVVFFGKKAW